MKKYARLIDALGASVVVSGTYMVRYEDQVIEAAKSIAEREGSNYEDKLITCRMGSIIEHAVCALLNTDDMWSRMSKQRNFEERKYDIETILKNNALGTWIQKSILIDTKSSNKSCEGDYFAFNNSGVCKVRRPGSDLHNFISYASNTELLVIAKRTGDLELGGTNIVTPTYIIHRDAFDKCTVKESQYESSPFFYTRYSEMIKEGCCVKINPSETTLTLK